MVTPLDLVHLEFSDLNQDIDLICVSRKIIPVTHPVDGYWKF